MSMLQELFNNYTNGDLYKGNEESKGTLEMLEQCLKALSNPATETKSVMPDLIVSYGVEREELGFINGFRHGVQIMAECFTQKGGVSNE